jgi:hypothetical protein
VRQEALRRSRIEAELAAEAAVRESAIRRSRLEAELVAEESIRRSRVQAELEADYWRRYYRI